MEKCSTLLYNQAINDRYTHPDHLFINEEFYSIQGEGLHTGVPMYFVRLQGCEVGCYFCDTKYTWRQETNIENNPRKQHIGDIYNRIQKSQTDWVCITGGEPYEQDFYRLAEICNYYQKKVHVETSGTVWQNIPANWITLSPKDLFSKKKTLEHFKRLAHEIKVVVTKKEDLKYYVEQYYEYCSYNKPLIFQMVDNDTKLVDMTLKFIKSNGLDNARIMLQQHKVIQLR